MQTGATDLHFAMASKMRPRIFRRHIHIHAGKYIYISFRRIELVKRKRDENIVLTRVTAYYSVATCKRIPEDEPLPFRISLNDVYQARYNNFAIIFLSSYYIATSHAYGFLTDGLTSLK